MAAVTSKVDICNMALGHLGNRNSVANIDTPKSDKEITFALWYDITRQNLLKTLMPNFALNRLIVSAVAVPAGYVNAYSFAYEYPHRCLRLLGINNIDCVNNPPTVENGIIFLNEEYATGLPIRFVDDITDVTSMTSDFIMALSVELAERVALVLTQDQAKKKAMQAQKPSENANSTAVSAQENKPVRRSISRFRQSRFINLAENSDKK